MRSDSPAERRVTSAGRRRLARRDPRPTVVEVLGPQRRQDRFERRRVEVRQFHDGPGPLARRRPRLRQVRRARLRHLMPDRHGDDTECARHQRDLPDALPRFRENEEEGARRVEQRPHLPLRAGDHRLIVERNAFRHPGAQRVQFGDGDALDHRRVAADLAGTARALPGEDHQRGVRPDVGEELGEAHGDVGQRTVDDVPHGTENICR